MTYLLRYVIERFMNVYQAVFLLFIWSFQEASFLQISQITQMHRLTIIIIVFSCKWRTTLDFRPKILYLCIVIETQWLAETKDLQSMFN